MVELKNSRKGKPNKVRGINGIKEYYKFYLKNYVPNKESKYYLKQTKFKKILQDFNNMMLEEIVLNNYEFKLPFRMGKLCLRKLKPKKEIDKNNKLINKNPVDVKSTMELWNKDKEAKDKKVLIRFTNKHSNGFIFFIRYDKSTANYKNKTVYHMKFHRKVKLFINKASKEYNIDAFLI